MTPRRPTHLCTGEFELDWMLVYELLRTRLQQKRAVFGTHYTSISLVRVCVTHTHTALRALQNRVKAAVHVQRRHGVRGTSPPRPPHTPARPSPHDGPSAVGLHGEGDA